MTRRMVRITCPFCGATHEIIFETKEEVDEHKENFFNNGKICGGCGRLIFVTTKGSDDVYVIVRLHPDLDPTRYSRYVRIPRTSLDDGDLPF